MLYSLHGRSLLTLKDFTQKEINGLLDLATELKVKKDAECEHQYLKGKSIALIFEKDSTRTRIGFEVAAFDQGAHVTFLGPTDTPIGTKESIKDTARVLGRIYDGIEYRGFEQKTVEILAQYAGVPVFNGLTNEYHPTQILADFLTMQEQADRSLDGMTLCFIGNARNNVGHSLLLGAAIMGADVRICAPVSCQPETTIQQAARAYAEKSGATITVTADVNKAVRGCDFIYTDVWVSMGEPESVWGVRIDQLRPYQVTMDVLDAAQNNDVSFMHCLPAYHNADTVIGKKVKRVYGLDAMEVTDEVFESDRSIVFEQAENRMHTIKAVMVASLYNFS